MARSKSRYQQARPDGQIRMSQVITTYGPGSMVDLVDHAILVAGLDFWSYDRDKGVATIDDEPRLRDAVAESLRKAEVELAADGAFRLPPAGDDASASRSCGIPALEFPRWFVCQNPACRALVRTDGLELRSGRYRHMECTQKRSGSECVPVRFVAACSRGHLTEFPWVAFAHRRQRRDGPTTCASPRLQLIEGASGDFSEVVVRCCACHAKARLSEAMATKASLPECKGHRPWLGPDARENCEERLRLLVRTASHGYFSLIESALSIREAHRELDDLVAREWRYLKAAKDLPALTSIRGLYADDLAELSSYSDEDVLAAIASRRSGKPPAREPLRTAEFRKIVGSEWERPGVVPPDDEVFYARRIASAREGGAASGAPQGDLGEALPPGVGGVVLVHKLRQVKVQVGFTRFESITPDLQGEYDLGVESARLGLASNWLPGSELYGEGVFLELDEEAVSDWEHREPVIERGRALAIGYRSAHPEGRKAPPFPGVRLYLLHSLSHLLMSAMSLECGYSASALSERLYCTLPGASVPMAGILIFTGTAGSEGTLGGLIEQGRRMTEHLRHAWDLGRLCSSDPVCAYHSPQGDPAERYLEGAACHGCLYVAECSCERFNRFLDRALVVPALGHDPELAFFGRRP